MGVQNKQLSSSNSDTLTCGRLEDIAEERRGHSNMSDWSDINESAKVLSPQSFKDSAEASATNSILNKVVDLNTGLRRHSTHSHLLGKPSKSREKTSSQDGDLSIPNIARLYKRTASENLADLAAPHIAENVLLGHPPGSKRSVSDRVMDSAYPVHGKQISPQTTDGFDADAPTEVFGRTRAVSENYIERNRRKSIVVHTKSKPKNVRVPELSHALFRAMEGTIAEPRCVARNCVIEGGKKGRSTTPIFAMCNPLSLKDKSRATTFSVSTAARATKSGNWSIVVSLTGDGDWLLRGETRPMKFRAGGPKCQTTKGGITVTVTPGDTIGDIVLLNIVLSDRMAP